MDHSLYYANMQRLKKPKGCRAKATGGEAVLLILRTFGNTGSGVLRLFHQGFIAEATEGEAVVQLLRTFGNTGYEALRLLRFV